MLSSGDGRRAEDCIGKHSVGIINMLLMTLNNRVSMAFSVVFLKLTNSQLL